MRWWIELGHALLELLNVEILFIGGEAELLFDLVELLAQEVILLALLDIVHDRSADLILELDRS